MGKGSARTVHLEMSSLPYEFSPFNWWFLGFLACLQCSTKNTLELPSNQRCFNCVCSS